jgi:histone H3/H4|tara:strand:- start:402 stop:599 length:198 start_codon:yes stop_codon:yes gene_type:complete
MISAEAPILFAKACEMFITEMTIKGYYNAEKQDRKTLQRKDLATAIARTETYDFLIDTIPKNELL